MIRFLIPSLLLLTISCQNEPLSLVDISINEHTAFALAEKQKGIYDLITLKTLEIVDSRCPSDVQCIQQGHAGVDIEVLANNNAIDTFQLCIGGCILWQRPDRMGTFEADTAYFTNQSKDYMLILEDVLPYPSQKNTKEVKRAKMKLIEL